MAKGMTIAGMVVAVLIVLMFMLDMIAGIPFGKAGGVVFDILFVLAALGMGFLSWTTLRDLK